MKRVLRLLTIVIFAGLAFSAFSCSDNDDELITATELPGDAQAFVSTYFPGVGIVSSYRDKDEYEIILENGTRIDFDNTGAWESVDAPTGTAVPQGFYPVAIDRYIEMKMPGQSINEISREKRGYEVELLTGTELYFSSDGAFVKFD